MTPIDLGPATQRLADLVRHVRDDQLDHPTPCPDYAVDDLLDHIDGLSQAFAAAAEKDLAKTAPDGPFVDGSRLGSDWRTRIPDHLAALAHAWRAPDAWTGMTQAGGVDLPGEIAGLVALDEIVIHGWDLARATGQAYECDEPSLEAVHGFVQQFAGPGQEEARQGLFGPEVEVPTDAPLLDRVVGMTGRDPSYGRA